MALFDFLKGNRMQDDPPGRDGQIDRGILVFENTSEVIQAEKLLKKRLGNTGHGPPAGNPAGVRSGHRISPDRRSLDSKNPKGKAGDDYSIRIYVMFSYDPTQAIRGECLTYGTAKAIYGQYPAHSALNYDILTLQDVPRVFGLSRKFSIRFWTFWITGN